MKMENWDKAVEHYDRAVYLAPHVPESYLKLGNALEERGNLLAALTQYQSANRLEPNNLLYKGYVGRGFALKGAEAKKPDMIEDGIVWMEKSIGGGLTDVRVYEVLALSYIELSTIDWTPNPENKEETFPTEDVHIANAKAGLLKANNLVGNSNLKVNLLAKEVENIVLVSTKRKYVGYKYLLKAPLIIGAIVFFFGSKAIAISLFIMSGLYYISQCKLGYKYNKLVFTDGFKVPFVMRRLDAMGDMISGITIFGTSLSNVMFMSWLYQTVFEMMRYICAIIYLPFEIIRGFVVNYGVNLRGILSFLSDKKAMTEVKNNLTQKVNTVVQTAQTTIESVKKTTETVVKPIESKEIVQIPELTANSLSDISTVEIIEPSPAISVAPIKTPKAKPKSVRAKTTESFTKVSKSVEIEAVVPTSESLKLLENQEIAIEKPIETIVEETKTTPFEPAFEQPISTPKVIPIVVPKNNPQSIQPQNEVSDSQMNLAVKLLAALVGLVVIATIFMTIKSSFSSSETTVAILPKTEPAEKSPTVSVKQPVNVPPQNLEKNTPSPESALSIAYVHLEHSSNLILRALPTKDSKNLGSINDGSPVIVLGYDDHTTSLDGETNRWCKVNFEGNVGWVWGKFLVKK
jgi:hypothetical protein